MNTIDEMMRLAREAQGRAYAPYSQHHVGAVVRAATGRLYGGCNVENAAYPEGTCAEAGALAAMVMGGERKAVEVVVTGPAGVACTPCGGCRQKLREFCEPNTPVHVCDPDGLVMSTTVGALLPHDFGPANLGRTTK